MDDENMLIEYGFNVFKSVLEECPFVSGLLKTITDENNNLLIERIKCLESRIDDLEYFEHQLNYLKNDTNKYIHLRNFLSFYFTKCDPALIDVNINIFLDYIKEKYMHSSYDLLLEKMCLLSRESLNVMKKIKTMKKTGDYYEWKDLLSLYLNVDQTLKYRNILTSEELNNDLLEISFGLKNLIDNDFIISLSTSYPGSDDPYSVDQFSITNIGYLLLKYL